MRVKPCNWKRLHLDPPLRLFPALTEITHKRRAADHVPALELGFKP